MGQSIKGGPALQLWPFMSQVALVPRGWVAYSLCSAKQRSQSGPELNERNAWQSALMQLASHLRHPLNSRQIMVRGWVVEPEGGLRQLPSEIGESTARWRGEGGNGAGGLNLVLRDGEKFRPTETVGIGTSDWKSDSVNAVQSDSGGNTGG